MGHDEQHDEKLAQRRLVARKRAALDAAEEASASAQTAPAAEVQFWRILWEKLKKHMEYPPKG
jgi:hypothetical protein